MFYNPIYIENCVAQTTTVSIFYSLLIRIYFIRLWKEEYNFLECFNYMHFNISMESNFIVFTIYKKYLS